MFNLSRATEYSILLLLRLKQKKLVSLSQISKNSGLPLKFLEKVASRLKKAGLIKSKEGSKGGYFLAYEQISLKQIIQAQEGNKGLVSCINGECYLKKICTHKKVWLKLQKVLDKELSRIHLKDFI